MDRIKLLKSKGYWTEYIYAQKYNNKSNEEIAEGIIKAVEQVETLSKHNEALDLVSKRFWHFDTWDRNGRTETITIEAMNEKNATIILKSLRGDLYFDRPY